MDQELLQHRWETLQYLIIQAARQALADEKLPALKAGCKLSSFKGKFMQDADGSFVTFYISHKKIKLDIKVKAVYFSDEISVYLHYIPCACSKTYKGRGDTLPLENFTFLLRHPSKHVSFRHDFRTINGTVDPNALARGFRFIREIYEDHKTLYLSRRASEFHAVNERKMLAACMGTHARLGGNSLLRFLDGDVLAIIQRQMLAMYMREAGLIEKE
jgi:hypothetical protein